MMNPPQAADNTTALGYEPTNLFCVLGVGRPCAPELFQVPVGPWKHKEVVFSVLERQLQWYQVL